MLAAQQGQVTGLPEPRPQDQSFFSGYGEQGAGVLPVTPLYPGASQGAGQQTPTPVAGEPPKKKKVKKEEEKGKVKVKGKRDDSHPPGEPAATVKAADSDSEVIDPGKEKPAAPTLKLKLTKGITIKVSQTDPRLLFPFSLSPLGHQMNLFLFLSLLDWPWPTTSQSLKRRKSRKYLRR